MSGGELMETYVVYLYLALNQAKSLITDRFFKLNSYPIAGLIRPAPELTKMLPFKVRPFEIQQDNLYMLVYTASFLGARILKIELDESIDPDIYEEINLHLRTQNIKQLSLLIEHLQADEIEITAVSFLYEGRQFRITKYAVVEMVGEWDELPSLTEDTPIAYVTGIKGFPMERFDNI